MHTLTTANPEQQEMKRILILFITALCLGINAKAQTYTQHLQQKQGTAGVSVTQSKEIDDLVNGANVSAKQHNEFPTKKESTPIQRQDTHATTTTPHKQPTTAAQQPHRTTTTVEKQHDNDSLKRAEAEKKTKENAHKHETSSPEKDDYEIDAPTIDTRKKVMRRSYKVNGYRVQVFAGGNSRTDKTKAQQAGNKVKAAFPDIPVYVHFYSPRWICRMGNFRSYQEANAVLTQVRKMGYKQACIVSGKISVAY